MKMSYNEFRDFVHSANNYFYEQSKEWYKVHALISVLMSGRAVAEVDDELCEKFQAYFGAKKNLNDYLTGIFRHVKKPEEKEESEEKRDAKTVRNNSKRTKQHKDQNPG